ncbi:very short patch repair endonuclease [Pseudomonas chlororaphis]|uniref:very short patch repair endonuclease n=2 Tax=Pseudomonas chlororaphis TaxID=587753 RepID=UPI000E0B9862|nr:very short patch repair endonuclease [Pseudomonas chlororaphis]WDH48262.1 very short patch repair endonuclease [Pseudomonas chlororaphis]WDH60111.1 very short patch repair endonuclease [Pseudomonas chlororaphis]WQE19366.1 very short patch repair endonuclease [Pseudomonas chlororaphis]
MDRLSIERRSWLMSRVKGKNTAPELVVRRIVFGMGYRYRLHSKNLPGRPDLVFWGRKKLIFVNGCFWHGHDGCRYGRLPKTRIEYWQRKIERNKMRDAENIASLEADGWQVLTVWQCELVCIERLTNILHEFIKMDDRGTDSPSQ